MPNDTGTGGELVISLFAEIMGRYQETIVKQLAKVILLILTALVLTATQPQNGQTTSLCELLAHVIKDYERIKPGLQREQVEKFLQRDGGLQFPTPTRYVFPVCTFLHVDVEFGLKGEPGHLFGPGDIVRKASKIYVDYPVKD